MGFGDYCIFAIAFLVITWHIATLHDAIHIQNKIVIKNLAIMAKNIEEIASQLGLTEQEDSFYK